MIAGHSNGQPSRKIRKITTTSIAIALVIIFPAIATAFPEYLQAEARKAPVEQIKDDAPSLEQDTMEHMQEQSKDQYEEEQGEAKKNGEKAPGDAK